jgi:hypothetical protein
MSLAQPPSTPFTTSLVDLFLYIYPSLPTPTGISIPNPLRLLSALRPRSLVSLAQGQGKRVQRLVWRLEDASAFTAKFAVKAVVKGVRPAIVCECDV